MASEKSKYTAGGVILFILIIILLWYGYKNWGWFGGTKKEGSACTDTNGNSSVIENGVCKEVTIPTGVTYIR